MSQSEHDWAYAKRAFARGDDPEEIIRRIADFRGDQKHASYARRTVENAKQELQSGPDIQHTSGTVSEFVDEADRRQ